MGCDFIIHVHLVEKCLKGLCARGYAGRIHDIAPLLFHIENGRMLTEGEATPLTLIR